MSSLVELTSLVGKVGMSSLAKLTLAICDDFVLDIYFLRFGKDEIFLLMGQTLSFKVINWSYLARKFTPFGEYEIPLFAKLS